MKNLTLIAAVFLSAAAPSASALASGAITANDCTVALDHFVSGPKRGYPKGDYPEEILERGRIERRLENLGYRIVDAKENAEFRLSLRFERYDYIVDADAPRFLYWIDRNLFSGIEFWLYFRQDGKPAPIVQVDTERTDRVLHAKRVLRRALRQIPRCERN